MGLQSQTRLSNRATGTRFMKVKLQKLMRRRHVSRYLNKMSAVKFKGRLSYTEGPSISLYILQARVDALFYVRFVRDDESTGGRAGPSP